MRTAKAFSVAHAQYADSIRASIENFVRFCNRVMTRLQDLQVKVPNMRNKFFRIDDRSALDNLLTDSKQKPVIVFKHSNACSISSRAYREMEKLEAQVNILEVQTAREISRELANLTGVRHETPQVIVLRDGKAVWNASHFDVQAAAVTEAVESHR